MQKSSHLYPLDPKKPLVHAGVRVFRDGAPEYRFLDENKQFDVTVFTAAAVKRDTLEQGASGVKSVVLVVQKLRAVMKDRIDWLLGTMERSGVKSVVLSAWGCGAFGLDALEIAHLFKQRLSTSTLPEVTFEVLSDHNGPNNFEVFKKLLSRGP